MARPGAAGSTLVWAALALASGACVLAERVQAPDDVTSMMQVTRTLSSMLLDVEPPSPAPAFTVLATNMGCSNFAMLPSFGNFTNVSNAVCAQMCKITPGCLFWTYQDEANGTCLAQGPNGTVQPPLADDSCKLFGGECARENNSCWDLVTLSLPAPSPTPVPFTVVNPQTGCSNFNFLPVFGTYINVSNVICAQLCSQTPGCLFWTYQDLPNSACANVTSPPPVQPPVGDDACILFGGVCAKEANACFDVVTLNPPAPAPTPVPFTVVSPQTGCSNFNVLPALGTFINVSNVICAQICSQTPGCRFWTYQDLPNSACANVTSPPPVQPPVGDDACILFGGVCTREANTCWDLVTFAQVATPAPTQVGASVASGTMTLVFNGNIPSLVQIKASVIAALSAFLGVPVPQIFVTASLSAPRVRNTPASGRVQRTPAATAVISFQVQTQDPNMASTFTNMLVAAVANPTSLLSAVQNAFNSLGLGITVASVALSNVNGGPPAPATAPVPFTVVSPMMGCSNFNVLPQFGTFINVSNVICAQFCSQTPGCLFWTYQDPPNSSCANVTSPPPVQPPVGDDACILFGGVCAKEANACFDVVTLSLPPPAPAPVPFTVVSPQMGCSNFDVLPAFGTFINVSNVICAQICSQTPGCLFWTYQDLPNSACANVTSPPPVQPPVGDDACILFGGVCAKEANACFDVVTLNPPAPSPAPVPFTVVSPQTGCSNFNVLPSFGTFINVSNVICAQICSQTPGCLFWTYQDLPNSACANITSPPPVQPPVGDDACILFGGVCVMEANACFDVVTFDTPAPAPAPVPFTVVSPQTGCSNFNVLPTFGTFINVSNVICSSICSQTPGCLFWTYQDLPNSACATSPSPVQPPVGDDACVLFGGVCATEANPCFDVVILDPPAPGPTPVPFTVVSPNTGCANFSAMPVFGTYINVSNVICAQICSQTPGCLFWTYQDVSNSACATSPPPVQPPVGDDACILFGGICEKEANPCWDVVTFAQAATPAPTMVGASVVSGTITLVFSGSIPALVQIKAGVKTALGAFLGTPVSSIFVTANLSSPRVRKPPASSRLQRTPTSGTAVLSFQVQTQDPTMAQTLFNLLTAALANPAGLLTAVQNAFNALGLGVTVTSLTLSNLQLLLGNAPVSATDDPHVMNLAGESFQVKQPGRYSLVRVPPEEDSPALVKLAAEIRQDVSDPCRLYIKGVAMAGSWLGDSVVQVLPLERDRPGSNTAGRAIRHPFRIRIAHPSDNMTLSWEELDHAEGGGAKVLGSGAVIQAVLREELSGVNEGRAFKFLIGTSSKKAEIIVAQASHQALNVQFTKAAYLQSVKVGGLMGTQRHDQRIEKATEVCLGRTAWAQTADTDRASLLAEQSSMMAAWD